MPAKTTRYLSMFFVLALTAVLWGQGREESATQRREAAAKSAPLRAVAVLMPIGDSRASGIVYFTQMGDQVSIQGRIQGLKPGKHGFHVHEFGDVSDLETGKSAGGHFDPTGQPHGRPGEDERHVGDLGNIEANEEGVAEIAMSDAVIQLSGPHSILGRGLVVHAGEDRYTQPSGDAGDRVSIGVIGVAEKKQ